MRRALGRRLLPAFMALGALACGGGDAPADGEADGLATTPDTIGGAVDTLVAPPGALPGAAGGAGAAGTGGTAGAAGADAPAAGGGTGAPTGGGASGSGGEAAPAALTMTGTVRLTGTAEAPLLTLATADATWLLRGEPVAELRRLDGATVRVTGRPAGEPGRLQPLEVASYVLESIGGETPYVGRIELADDGAPVLVTQSGTLRLSGAGGLVDQEGAHVWVLGQRSGEALSVASYGVIRPAG